MSFPQGYPLQLQAPQSQACPAWVPQQPGRIPDLPRKIGPLPTIGSVPKFGVPSMSFRESPVLMRCFYCQLDMLTETRYEFGWATWLAAGACVVSGFWFCCCIPFFMTSLKNVVHSCPFCERKVGKYSRC